MAAPDLSRAALGLGHGAGGDMNSAFLAGVAEALGSAGVASLRFNFPYKEQGRKSPDPPKALLDSWREAFGVCERLEVPAWAGGKSLGGRIASMAVAEGMPARGLVFFGYPLHPPGRPTGSETPTSTKSGSRCCSSRGPRILLRSGACSSR